MALVTARRLYTARYLKAKRRMKNIAMCVKAIKKKTVKVAAALIKKDRRVFAAQRKKGEWKGFWEFPGGKIEEGETAEDALKREIKEELGVEVDVKRQIADVKYEYSDFLLLMRCFLCEIKSGKITLFEHEAGGFFLISELKNARLLPADEILVNELEKDESFANER